MRVKRFLNHKELYNVSKEYLMKKEAENGLILGLLKSDSYPINDDDLYIAIYNQDISFVCIKRGKGLILAGNQEDFKVHIDLLISYLEKEKLVYPSILGPKYIVEYFKGQLLMMGRKVDLAMSQRIYKLTSVNEIPLSSGSLKPATADYLDVLISWFKDFGLAAGDKISDEYAKKRMSFLIDNNKLFLWHDQGKPVSMVAEVRDTGNGATVSMVYTPIELRGLGYASSAVWTISKKLLESYDFTMLYTDLANPTSNKIYMNIGYESVVDSALYMVEEKE